MPREPYAGPGPWSVLIAGPWSFGHAGPRYVQTPDDDPAFLYQDVLIALDPARGINIDEPSLHAHCLDALAVAADETVLHVGAGSGYYTAILAHLAGPGGAVTPSRSTPTWRPAPRANSPDARGCKCKRAPALRTICRGWTQSM